jgi:signal peptidase I
MARHRPDDEDEVLDDEEEDEPHGRGYASSSRKKRRSVRPWKAGEEGEEATGTTGSHRPRWPTYYRARDSLFFEPLVALAIIVLLLVSLWAYTQNWPPMYVVESSSMQHGTSDQVSLINTGDLVLAQKIDSSRITTYVVGAQTSYSTYGEYGDVILYHPEGDTAPAPIIHRAILYVVANGDGTWSVPSLQGQPCGPGPDSVYVLSSTGSGCGTSHITGTMTLKKVGWQQVSVSVALDTLGSVSGFITMGDNNFIPGNPGTGITDQQAGRSLVQSPWIVGVARGMIPWFGSFKLLIEGQASEVPSQSWAYMGLTIVAFVLLAFGIHYAIRSAGRRPGDRWEDDDDAVDDEELPPPKHRRSRRKSDEDDEDDDEPSTPRGKHGTSSSSRHGRPPPEVKKPTHHFWQRSKAPADDDDEDL